MVLPKNGFKTFNYTYNLPKSAPFVNLVWRWDLHQRSIFGTGVSPKSSKTKIIELASGNTKTGLVRVFSKTKQFALPLQFGSMLIFLRCGVARCLHAERADHPISRTELIAPLAPALFSRDLLVTAVSVLSKDRSVRLDA
jgi:hypothetical protein